MHQLRWQLLVAACAALIVFALLGSVALSSAATTESLQGTVYVEGVVGAPRQLNPLAQSASASPAERDLAALIFEGLTRTGPDGAVEPALAERWSVDAAGRVYTFVLRAGATWQDGAPVTADDVLYTVRGVQNANFPGDPALPRVWRDILVRKQDDRTIQFELNAPFAPFPAIADLPILPAHLYRTLRPEQWAGAEWSRRPVGTGRYQLHALDAEKAVLVPFAGHPDAAALDNLVLRFYPTADAAMLGATRREVEGVAISALAGQRLPDPARQSQRLNVPLATYTTLTFNLRQAPLSDPQLRAALALGINREALVSTVLGAQGRVLDTPILPGSWAADTAARLPAFRRSAAQQQLGSLGYVDANGDGWVEADGQRLVLPLLYADTIEGRAVAAELERQLRAIGIGVEQTRVAPAELPAELAAHNFTLALNSWSGVGAEPDVYALWHSSRADAGTNYAGLSDSRIDQLLEQGRSTSDIDARKQIYAEFQRRWVELVPSLPLYQGMLAYDVETDVPAPAAPPLLLDASSRFATLERWIAP